MASKLRILFIRVVLVLAFGFILTPSRFPGRSHFIPAYVLLFLFFWWIPARKFRAIYTFGNVDGDLDR